MSKKQPKITLNFRWTHLIHNKDELIFWSCSIVDNWLNYFKQPLRLVPQYRVTIFWPSGRPQKVDPIRTRAFGTHSTAFRATCTHYFNKFMAHYLWKLPRSVSRHPIMRFSFWKRLSISFRLIITRIYLKSIISITVFSDFFLVCKKWSPCLMEPLLKSTFG